MKRLVLGTLGLVGAVAAGWTVFARRQGDAELVCEQQTLSNVVAHDRTLLGEVTIANRGRQGGVLHRFDGRIVEGPPGRVLVTRKGSKPPEPGWWVSNVLKPGDSCVAEVNVELDEPAEGPVVIELDVHEMGRRLLVHRIFRLTVPAPATQAAG